MQDSLQKATKSIYEKLSDYKKKKKFFKGKSLN